MDERTTYMQQLQDDDGPVVLINQFNVAPEDVERFLTVWADDASFMKQQPGFISTQLHRGTAGSTTFNERGRVGVREGARPRVPLARVPELRRALPGHRRRGATRLREDRRPRDLCGVELARELITPSPMPVMRTRGA
jgi:hypothetical protein